MNVSIQTAMGLRVYRELVENELSAPAKWEMNYGVHNQLKPIDRQKLLRVDGLEAAKSLPMPLAVQLFHLQRERIQAIRDSKEWEANALPKFSRHPISKTAVDIFGEKTAHAQRPHAEKRDRPVSAPVTYSQGPPHRCVCVRARAGSESGGVRGRRVGDEGYRTPAS